MTKITVSEFGTVADVDADAPLTDKQIVDAMAQWKKNERRKSKTTKVAQTEPKRFVIRILYVSNAMLLYQFRIRQKSTHTETHAVINFR
jgi:hypothetical protein